MPKKLLIFIIIVVLALIILGVLYYIGMPDQKIMEKQNEITSMSLIRFPAGTEVTQETEGIEASTFKKGDLIKATGTIKFAEGEEKTVLTSQIFNKGGEKIEEVYTPEVEIKAVNFGSCCIQSPDEIGEYTLKFFLDGKEAKSINFEVIE